MRSHLFYPYTHQCFMINYLKKKQNNIEKATLIRYQIRWRFFTEPGRVFHLPEHQSTIHHYVIHSNASLFLTYRHIPLDILPGYRSKVAPPRHDVRVRLPNTKMILAPDARAGKGEGCI